MGLDIYLKKCSDLPRAIADSEEAERQVDAEWEKLGIEYNQLTDDQKEETRDAARAACAALNCNEYGISNLIIDCPEIDSAVYPEHLFKIGYWRSSYNSGGINSILTRRGVPNLYDIFNPWLNQGDDYYVRPDWNQALDATNDAIAKLVAFLNSPSGKYDAVECRGIERAADAADAMRLFTKELANHESGNSRRWASYSNGIGYFWFDKLNVVAQIQGPGQTSFLIVEREKTEEPDWYLQALLIVRETIEYVLAQPDSEQYFLGWSG